MLDWFGMLWDFKWDYLSGAKITVLLSLFSVLAGFILGVVIVLVRMSGFKPLKWLTTAYIELVRGTPLLVQIFIIYFGLTEFGIEFSPFMAGVVAVSINSSAYLSEIFRAGIQAIDRGQAEAARSLGMSKAMTLRYIVLPLGVSQRPACDWQRVRDHYKGNVHCQLHRHYGHHVPNRGHTE